MTTKEDDEKIMRAAKRFGLIGIIIAVIAFPMMIAGIWVDWRIALTAVVVFIFAVFVFALGFLISLGKYS